MDGMRRLGGIAAAVVAAALLVAIASGCGDDGGAGAAGTSSAERPTVLAAASLAEAFPAIDGAPRYSFAGSDTLALQIRQGAPADVFASAAPTYTQALYRQGLVERPRLLAANRLAVIVPAGNPAGIAAVADLTAPGVRLVLASEDVPVGGYAREALRTLGLGAALGNVVSEEPDVKDVVGKVALGQADAGVVYTTDARAAGDRVRVVTVPARAQPDIRYEIAVVAAAPHPAAARAFVARATGPEGRAALARAGVAVAAAAP
jgi:molybdate transport system substrate-binding protein